MSKAKLRELVAEAKLRRSESPLDTFVRHMSDSFSEAADAMGKWGSNAVDPEFWRDELGLDQRTPLGGAGAAPAGKKGSAKQKQQKRGGTNSRKRAQFADEEASQASTTARSLGSEEKGEDVTLPKTDDFSWELNIYFVEQPPEGGAKPKYKLAEHLEEMKSPEYRREKARERWLRENTRDQLYTGKGSVPAGTGRAPRVKDVLTLQDHERPLLPPFAAEQEKKREDGRRKASVTGGSQPIPNQYQQQRQSSLRRPTQQRQSSFRPTQQPKRASAAQRRKSSFRDNGGSMPLQQQQRKSIPRRASEAKQQQPRRSSRRSSGSFTGSSYSGSKSSYYSSDNEGSESDYSSSRDSSSFSSDFSSSQGSSFSSSAASSSFASSASSSFATSDGSSFMSSFSSAAPSSFAINNDANQKRGRNSSIRG